jgi:hypothetical protein
MNKGPKVAAILDKLKRMNIVRLEEVVAEVDLVDVPIFILAKEMSLPRPSIPL